MIELTEQGVAQKVRDHIRDCRPGGVTLEVVEEGIHRVNGWWRVPVRPSAWPARMFEYYEALAEVESDIQEKENLNILLSTGEPVEREEAPAKAA